MHLLKNISIGIDDRKDGVDFNLNLYSKGSKADYRDDFPSSIVRVTGARFEIVNKSQNDLMFNKLVLGIFIKKKIVTAFTSKYVANHKLNKGENFEIAFEGKELIKIFDNYNEEKGILFILNETEMHHSNYFDGDFLENELDRLNEETDPEYQNWHTHEFSKLDFEIPFNQIDKRIKFIESKTIAKKC